MAGFSVSPGASRRAWYVRELGCSEPSERMQAAFVVFEKNAV
jgi:hypothetical protein